MNKKVLILFTTSLLLLIISFSFVNNNEDSTKVTARCYSVDNKTIVEILEKFEIKINGEVYGYDSKVRLIVNKSYSTINIKYRGKKLIVTCKNLS